MTSTAMAAEMTPSPRWSSRWRAIARCTVVQNLAITESLFSYRSLRAGELPQCLDEWNRKEDHAGNQGRHRDRDPDLLAPPLHRLDQLAVAVGPDRPGLLRDEAAEVAGFTVQREHWDESIQCRHPGHRGPFPQRFDFGQTLPCPVTDTSQIGGGGATSAVGQPVERGAERVAR